MDALLTVGELIDKLQTFPRDTFIQILTENGRFAIDSAEIGGEDGYVDLKVSGEEFGPPNGRDS